jgi:hypothetical protein
MAMIFHKQRRDERTTIAVPARVLVDDYDRPAMLLNVSAHGVMAALPQPPKRGTRIRLIVGELELVGQVRWSGVDCCGVALRDAISVADLLDGRTTPPAFIPQPRALRGLGGMLRSLVSEYKLS